MQWCFYVTAFNTKYYVQQKVLSVTGSICIGIIKSDRKVDMYCRSKKVNKRKREKTEYLSGLQCKLSQRNKTCTNQHGILYASIRCLKVFLRGPFTCGSLPSFNFFSVNLRNCKVRHTNCITTNFHNVSDINLRVIRRRNYN